MVNHKIENTETLWSETHKETLSGFIQNLNDHKIQFFILRNYEGLPEHNVSKDVDFVINPKQYSEACTILLNVFKEYKFTQIHVHKFSHVHCYFAMNYHEKNAIEIDLLKGCYIKGFELFSFDLLYNNVICCKNFHVLPKSIEVVLLLLYKIIGWQKIKPKYKKEIEEASSNDFESLNSFLNISFGTKKANILLNELHNKNYDAIIQKSKTYKVSYRKRIFLKKPVSTLIDINKFLLKQMSNVFRKPKLIGVLGADGTGKSTFIDGLVNAIAFYYVSDESKSHIYHHRPTLLPNLGAAGEKAGVMKEDKDFTNPHRAKPAGFISSFIRMTYYWLDYVIGVPVKLRKDVQFDRFTIYDRYIYDFLVDPYRSRINLPYWLRKLFTKLVIQPRIVFVLLADAETIYKRKQELTIDEINRQLSEFKKLAETNKRFVIIDASKKPEEMVEDAVKIVIDKFTEKL